MRPDRDGRSVAVRRPRGSDRWRSLSSSMLFRQLSAVDIARRLGATGDFAEVRLESAGG
jgi:hypothetical protein